MDAEHAKRQANGSSVSPHMFHDSLVDTRTSLAAGFASTQPIFETLNYGKKYEMVTMIRDIPIEFVVGQYKFPHKCPVPAFSNPAPGGTGRDESDNCYWVRDLNVILEHFRDEELKGIDGWYGLWIVSRRVPPVDVYDCRLSGIQSAGLLQRRYFGGIFPIF